jgi:hypothetical protein
MAVNNCIRLYGNMITIQDVYEIYSDEAKAKKLFFDPFGKVREIYNGVESLTLKDFDRWVTTGVFNKSANGKLSDSAVEAREKIEIHLDKKNELSASQKTAKAKEPDFSDEDATHLSRRLRSGGASTGYRRWKASHDKTN